MSSAGIRPRQRPSSSRAWVAKLCTGYGLDPEKDVIVVGRRGYELTMRTPGENDRNVYDDAIYIIGPDGVFHAFNANTDPSNHVQNRAELVVGVWKMRAGWHPLKEGSPTRHKAYRQYGSFIVARHGTEAVPKDTTDERGTCIGGGRWSGEFGINLHRGGNGTTSSHGCQTIPPEQWDEFYWTLYKLVGERAFPYLLTENTGK